ncbi:MAG: SDR family oxidoreductase [Methylacidiphilales bacterium]|nr:SDR family oxidoreductase [Candidatus Methylacidiphilales bacterium]
MLNSSFISALPARSSDKDSRVLVFGATGYIGSHLVPRLLQQGCAVRASGRNRKVLEARGWQGIQLVEADALLPDTLQGALAGVDTAYYLVHSMATGTDFGRLDLQAAKNFAVAAEHAGVRRIVYLGGLIPKDADSEHLVSRRDTGETLRSGRVPVTEIRAGIIVGPGSAAYEVVRDLVNHLPLMLTPRWVRSKSSPIALENLLEYLVRVASLDEAAGKVLDAAGPDYISYEELMCQYGEVVGKLPRIVRVPVLTPELSARWLSLITSVPTNIARALIGGLKHDLQADDAELRRLVPQKLLSFRESVAAALQAERTHTVAARWSEGQLMFRGFRLDNAFYAKRASGTGHGRASASAVWHTVATIGGNNGYYAMGWLWWIRGMMDWLVGPGLTRGRRHPIDLRVGDRIDSWTVLALEPARRLTLHFGMRAPGSGVLEFEVDPEPASTLRHCTRTRLTITAYWHPQGVWGLLYWYAMAPVHLFIFRRMARAMLRRAEQFDAERIKDSGVAG